VKKLLEIKRLGLLSLHALGLQLHLPLHESLQVHARLKLHVLLAQHVVLDIILRRQLLHEVRVSAVVVTVGIHEVSRDRDFHGPGHQTSQALKTRRRTKGVKANWDVALLHQASRHNVSVLEK
jgi:hypothetical protein